MAGRVGDLERIDRADLDATLARVTALADVMDQAVTIPGTNVRMGLAGC